MSTATPTGHSYLDKFETCPRLFKYYEINKLVAPVSMNLAIGTALHAGVCRFYERLESDIRRSSDALQAALDSLAEQYANITDPIMAQDYVRAIQVTESTIAGYCDFYRQESDFETVGLEVEFSYPLAVDGELYTGRLDRMVRSRTDKMLYIMEHKSSGEHPNAFFKRYLLDPKITGYVWGAEQLYQEPIAGVIMNALFKPRLNPPKKDGTQTLGQPSYMRETFIRTKVEIEEWMEETIEKRRRLREAITRYAAGEPNVFTKREQSCVRYGRTCEFIKVCEHQQADFVMEEFRHVG